MANVFKPKRSNISSSVPTTGQLADGELAVNSADKKIFIRDGASVVEVANFSTGGSGTEYWTQTDVGIHTLSNVGIGTTNPTSKLEVVGIVSATSYYGDGSNLLIPKFLTVGVRSGIAVTFSISNNAFNVLNRSGGNTPVNINL